MSLAVLVLCVRVCCFSLSGLLSSHLSLIGCFLIRFFFSLSILSVPHCFSSLWELDLLLSPFLFRLIGVFLIVFFFHLSNLIVIFCMGPRLVYLFISVRLPDVSVWELVSVIFLSSILLAFLSVYGSRGGYDFFLFVLLVSYFYLWIFY